MSNFSRRFFLILLGALATSGVAQSSDAASTKKPTPSIQRARGLTGSSGAKTGRRRCIAGGALLMLAHMDAEAIARTRETGFAHFHSRSRGRLWMKGESSGHVLKIIEIRVDCDQDALLVIARPDGPTCHTGVRSCFYRRVEGDQLVRL